MIVRVIMVVVVMIVIIVTMIVVTMVMVMLMIVVMLVVVVMRMIMRIMLVTLMGDRAVLTMLGIDGMLVSLDRRLGLRVGGTLDHLALDTVAMAAAAGIAMTRPAAMAAVLVLFLGLAMGALVGFDQRLTVGDRDLVIVGMDFGEGEEAVAVAAIFDESRLKRWLYTRYAGEVDVSFELLLVLRFEVKFFNAVTANDDDACFLRVGGID